MKLRMNFSKKINSNLFTQCEKNPSQFCYFKPLFFKPQNRNEMPKKLQIYSLYYAIMNKYFILLYIMSHILS